MNQIRYEKIQTEYNTPFKVMEIELKENSNLVDTYMHWHRSLEFVIPINNGNQTWVEGEIYHTYPDTMVLVNSKCIHGYAIINPNLSFQGYIVQFKYDFISNVIKDIDQYKFQSLFNKKEHPRIFELIHEVINAQKSQSPYQYIKLQSLAYELIYELVTNARVDQQKNAITQKSRLVEVLSYLDKHASDMFDATAIADYFHVSYGHLAKIFKRDLGMSMKDYVNSVRVRNASFDLLTTNVPIVEISSKHGFSSSKAFYKEFEKVYHMTPKQYRNVN